MGKNSKQIGYAALMAGMAAMTLGSCASSKSEKNSMNIVKVNEDPDMDNGFLILSDDSRSAVAKTNTFALNLFRTQVGMDSKVISPVSAAYLMAMLANGANGNTQSEIMRTLNLDGTSLKSLNEAYKSMINTSARLDSRTKINIANCIAVNRSVELKADYVKAMQSLYDANVESMDFGSPKSVGNINAWCSKQTNGMIPKIIDQLDNSALAVLMNAVYFNGTWADRFDKTLTKTENFRGYTRDIKRVPMMYQNSKLMYTDNSNYAAVQLPYGNGSYAMTVILPAEGKSVEDIAKSLTADGLNKMNGSMKECVVDLKMPRFTTSTETQLNKPISELGAPSMFISGKADFSKMSNANVFVSTMLQKAKIEVSEEGTKAAAVTAGIVMMTALRPEEPRHVVFHANRPFIYMITQRNTGAIFFIGQYTAD